MNCFQNFRVKDWFLLHSRSSTFCIFRVIKSPWGILGNKNSLAIPPIKHACLLRIAKQLRNVCFRNLMQSGIDAIKFYTNVSYIPASYKVVAEKTQFRTCNALLLLSNSRYDLLLVLYNYTFQNTYYTRYAAYIVKWCWK